MNAKQLDDWMQQIETLYSVVDSSSFEVFVDKCDDSIKSLTISLTMTCQIYNQNTLFRKFNSILIEMNTSSNNPRFIQFNTI